MTAEDRSKKDIPGVDAAVAVDLGPGDEAGAEPGPGREAVVRRTRDGWRVGDEDVPDLTCAMVLADLLAADLGAAGSGGGAPADGSGADGRAPAGPADTAQPAGAGPVAGEARRLRATVSQLQYALTARIRIEQAIGVLAERHRIHPRQAFEQLRTAARNRGRKVIDIASDVVASATNPLLQLPDELSRPRSAGRRAVRQPRGAH
jgi:ANTAR domain